MITFQRTADFLLAHRSSQRTVTNIPSDIYPRSWEAAYEVQQQVVGTLCEQHQSQVCGYKLACTNQFAMKWLGVDAPFSGRLLSHSTHQSGVTLATADFILRLIEPEFVFAVGQTVPATATPYNQETIKPYIDRFIPGIEIVDHRYVDFTRVGGAALIADNAIHGASILGEPVRDWRDIDFAQHPVTLGVNGEIRARGSGQNVLGHPLNAMAWLANHLQSQGRSLQSGDLVTTGTATSTYEAQSQDTIDVSFGPLGSVSVSFI